MAKKIPRIEDLISGTINQDDLTALLETQPPIEWLKVHPEHGNQYLPIERVDYLLRSIFDGHRTEVLSSPIYQNSCQVSVRLHTKHPMTGEWTFEDGVGGCESRQGIEKATAIAKANARKNAAKEYGAIFGRDLSRDYGEKVRPAAEGPVVEEAGKPEVVNPVATRIIKQMYACRSGETFMNCVRAFYRRAAEGEVDAEDEKILEAMYNKADKLQVNLKQEEHEQN